VPSAEPSPRAERFVKTIQYECLNHLVFFGERHLRHVVKELMAHYHHERNHQGLDKALIAPGEVTASTGKVVRRDRLGGLLGFYYREAA